MSDMDATARLAIALEGASETVRLLQKLQRSLDDGTGSADDLAKALNRAQRDAKGINDALDSLEKAAKKSGAATKDGAQGLDEYARSVKAVAAAERDAQQAITARNGAMGQSKSYSSSAPTKAVSYDFTAINAAKNSTQELDSAMSSLADGSAPRLRYALYDVATTAGVAGAALSGAAIGAVVSAGKFESAFTAVERTSGVVGAAADELESELVRLTRVIPDTFENIADLAARGAQLGVAEDQIASFTETVAQFVATSDTVTLDQAVEAFGRISNLMVDQDFNAIGSAITGVGVASAATEAQIVKATQELAPFANAVGMSTGQVIGLAAAVSSLGMAPEKSRSAFMSLQFTVDQAVSGINDKLSVFADYLEMSEEATARLWKTDPSQFIVSLTEAIAKSGDMTRALSDMGLSEKRAAQVFQGLAGNMREAGVEGSVLVQALNTATGAYNEGTAMADQYALIVDDLASKWQILQNAIMEVAAVMGATLGPGLKVLLDIITNLVQGWATFADTLVGRNISAAVLVVTALAGVFALLIGAVAAAGASIGAVRLALNELGLSSVFASGGIKGVIASLFGLSGAAGTATVGMKALRVAIAGTGVGLLVVGLGSLVGWLMDVGDASGQASSQVQELAASLSTAISKDTAIYNQTGQAIGTFTTQIAASTAAANDAADATQTYVGIQSQTGAAVDSATEAVTFQTRALGENADAWARKALADQGFIQQLANNPQLQETARLVGFNIDDFIAQGLEESGGFTQYLDNKVSVMERVVKESMALDSTDGGAAAQNVIEFSNALREVATTLDDARAVSEQSANTFQFLGLSADDAADGMNSVTDAATATYDSLVATQNATLGMENSLYRLGQSLADNGNAWDYFSEAGRANLGALGSTMDAIAATSPGNAAQIAANFQALYNMLIQGGFATEKQLAAIQARIKALGGVSTSVKPTIKSFGSVFSGISSGAAKASQSVTKARETIRTLVDYASDLDGVFNRSYDIRFGNDEAQDSVTKSWNKIADAIAKTREEMEEYQRTIQSLTADRAIKQYWLSVAEMYGDTLRAGKLREELAAMDREQAETQKKLDEAQKTTNKSLEGNTDVAIENRAEILALIQKYQDLMRSYAASGMSQEQLEQKSRELREEFLRQATSMGYNRGELEKYAVAFDDMSLAINRVPRGITVSADVNPALQALNEFAAKAAAQLAQAGGAAGRSYGDGFRAGMGDLEEPVQQQIRKTLYKTLPPAKKTMYKSTGHTFAGGGHTGYSPNASAVAGTVGFGEFVFDRQATRNIGPNNLALMHSMAKRPMSLSSGAGDSTRPVELSARTIRAIADAVGRMNIVLPGAQLAESVSGRNVVSAGAGRG